MAWNVMFNPIRDHLADNIPDREVSMTIVQSAGIPINLIRNSEVPTVRWQSIVDESAKHGKLKDLLGAASSFYPSDTELARMSNNLDVGWMPDLAIDWDELVGELHLESFLGRESALAPVSFLQRGWTAQQSVCRVRTGEQNGTGFLIKNNLLVTNNHIIPSEQVARQTQVDFNYQTDDMGTDLEPVTYQLDPNAGFATNSQKGRDWTAVSVDGDDLARWGFLRPVESGLTREDRVNVIQHPHGEHKQISFFHNEVIRVTQEIVWYLTDTQPGSSGSPVFDRRWGLVALHHGWVEKRGLVVEGNFYCNQGTLIWRVLDEIAEAGLDHGFTRG